MSQLQQNQRCIHVPTRQCGKAKEVLTNGAVFSGDNGSEFHALFTELLWLKVPPAAQVIHTLDKGTGEIVTNTLPSAARLSNSSNNADNSMGLSNEVQS